MTDISITSDAFTQGGRIPVRYSCSGENVSPPLSWSDPPGGTKCLALICDDPDAPGGLFTHWVLYDIPHGKRKLSEGVKKAPVLDDGSRHGINNFGRIEYSGPCPPPGKPHRYYFRIFALDTILNLRSPADRKTIDKAMAGHILASGEIMGTFSR